MPGLETMTLGHHRLVRLLGRGGMAEVYLAFDEHLRREVAIKVVPQSQDEHFRRFQREAETIGPLTHEHILQVFEYGEQGTWHYLVMPYVAQGTLQDRLNTRGPLEPAVAGIIIEQVASALQFAHERGILHRDLKPSNILLRDDTYAYLADFGIAKDQERASDLTQAGAILGTPAYMAPELIEGQASPRSDIYALGIVLYQMLTNKVPFQGNSPTATMIKQLKEAPIPPSRLNPAITPALEQVILTSLAKDPNQRYQTPMAMAQAYQQALLGQPGSDGGFIQQPQQQPWMPTYRGPATTANFQPSDQTVANYTQGAGYPPQQSYANYAQGNSNGNGYSIPQPQAPQFPQEYQRRKSGSGKMLPIAILLVLVALAALIFLILRPHMPAGNNTSTPPTSTAQSNNPPATTTPTNTCTQKVNIQDSANILKDTNGVCSAAKGLNYNVAIFTFDDAAHNPAQDATALIGSVSGDKPTFIISIQVNNTNNNVLSYFSYASRGAIGISGGQYAAFQNTFLNTLKQNNYTDYSQATETALQTLQGNADDSQTQAGIPGVYTQQWGNDTYGKHKKG